MYGVIVFRHDSVHWQSTALMNRHPTMMKYPYIAYSPHIEIFPLFTELKGDPFILDMSDTGPIFEGIDVRDQQAFQHRLDRMMAEKNCTWGVASYLENRKKALSSCPQMVEEARFYHLGLDVIVPLGTALHAPLSASVKASGYEAGDGNYGGYVLLEHSASPAESGADSGSDTTHSDERPPSNSGETQRRHQEQPFETFYSFYGHLHRDTLPQPGDRFDAGAPFAQIGDFHENGNWFYHTHLQILTQKAFDSGYISKGYCAATDLAVMDSLCPSPLSLFRL